MLQFGLNSGLFRASQWDTFLLLDGCANSTIDCCSHPSNARSPAHLPKSPAARIEVACLKDNSSNTVNWVNCLRVWVTNTVHPGAFLCFSPTADKSARICDSFDVRTHFEKVIIGRTINLWWFDYANEWTGWSIDMSQQIKCGKARIRRPGRRIYIVQWFSLCRQTYNLRKCDYGGRPKKPACNRFSLLARVLI